MVHAVAVRGLRSETGSNRCRDPLPVDGNDQTFRFEGRLVSPLCLAMECEAIRPMHLGCDNVVVQDRSESHLRFFCFISLELSVALPPGHIFNRFPTSAYHPSLPSYKPICVHLHEQTFVPVHLFRDTIWSCQYRICAFSNSESILDGPQVTLARFYNFRVTFNSRLLAMNSGPLKARVILLQTGQSYSILTLSFSSHPRRCTCL